MIRGSCGRFSRHVKKAWHAQSAGGGSLVCSSLWNTLETVFGNAVGWEFDQVAGSHVFPISNMM